MKKLAIGLLALISVPAMAQDRVSKFDINGDAKVDFAELSVSCEVSKSLFERADKNGDAKVDFAELSTSCEVSKSLFERADKDGDGVLSNSEMRTAKAYLFSKCKEEKNA